MTLQNNKRGGKFGFSRLLAMLTICALLLGALSVTVLAEDDAEAEKECSLELHYKHVEKVFEGCGVKLFRVAEVSADGTYTLIGPFAEYKVKVNDVQDQTEWQQAAETLAAYIVADSIAPDQEAKTDAEGTVKFSSLKTGLYLVISEDAVTDDCTYVFAPFLISLPNPGEDGNPVYDVVSNPKSESHIPTPDEVEHRVVKLWNDAGNKKYRPVSITVDIYRNGEKYSEQVLSEDNDWSYAWTSPDDGSVWQVVERDVPEHYTVTVRENETIITVINTVDDVPDPKPPQTGDGSHIELYVLIMAISGTVLLLLGMAKTRSDVHAKK